VGNHSSYVTYGGSERGQGKDKGALILRASWRLTSSADDD
jgi:hypothetical protein